MSFSFYITLFVVPFNVECNSTGEGETLAEATTSEDEGETLAEATTLRMNQ